MPQYCNGVIGPRESRRQKQRIEDLPVLNYDDEIS
jgi:hypothetical protein